MSDPHPVSRNSQVVPGLSRRTMVVGATWAAPVIVIATAAPALAYSGPLPNVVVTVRQATQSSTVVLYELTFTNSGGPTTAFTHTDAFTRTTAVGSGNISMVEYETGWSYVSSTGTAAQQNVVMQKVDGVLPTGTTVTLIQYTASATTYRSTIAFMPNPTPGTGTSGAGVFDPTQPRSSTLGRGRSLPQSRLLPPLS